MRKEIIMLVTAAGAFLFNSAPALAQAGLCSDSRTTNLVKRVYRQALDKFVAGLGAPDSWANEIDRLVPVEVRSVRTVRIDQGVGRHHCEATLEAKLTARGSEAVSNPVFQAGLSQDPDLRGFQTKGALVTHPVRYTVQLTDDKKEIHVQAVGHQNMADLVFNLTIPEVNDKMTQAPKAEPKPVPAAPRAAVKPQVSDSTEKTGICKGLDLAITSEQHECLSRKFKVADDALNATWKEVFEKLTVTQKTQLRTLQRTWIQEKNSKCLKAGEGAKNASLESILTADCEVQMTEQRIAFLKAYRP